MENENCFFVDIVEESLEWEKTVSFAEPPFPIPRPLLRGQFEQV